MKRFSPYLSALTGRRRFRARRRGRRREHHLPLARRRRRPLLVGRRRRNLRFGHRGGAPLHRLLRQRRRQRRARPAVVRVVSGVLLHEVSLGAFPPSAAAVQERARRHLDGGYIFPAFLERKYRICLLFFICPSTCIPVDVAIILDVHEVVEPAGRLGVVATAGLVVPVHRAQVRIVLVAVTGRPDDANATAAPPCGEPLPVVNVLAPICQM